MMGQWVNQPIVSSYHIEDCLSGLVTLTWIFGSPSFVSRCQQMAACVCEIMNVKSSVNSYNLLSNKYPIIIFDLYLFKDLVYRGSSTCTVSTSTISTSTNFQIVLHNVVLVGDLISKFVLVELIVCTTQLHSAAF